MWDKRYDTDEFLYGTEPNGFLKSVVSQIPPGDVLCLAEGEGRNAVYLAQQGFRVTAVDSSAVGLAKAKRLAAERSVAIVTTVVDLAHFEIARERWDGIVSIFAHVPGALRRSLHRNVVDGLRRGGVFVLEAYTPRQLRYRTGGPPDEDKLMTLAALREELAGLEFRHAVEIDREVVEGKLHTGMGAVVQIVAVKP
jgi:SAM-dependent methyltransferase